MARRKTPKLDSAVVELHIGFAPVPIRVWRGIAEGIHKVLSENKVQIEEWEICCYRPDSESEALNFDIFGSTD